LSERLLKQINDAGRVYMIPAKLRYKFIIRTAIASRMTEPGDVKATFDEIRRTNHADNLLNPKLNN